MKKNTPPRFLFYPRIETLEQRLPPGNLLTSSLMGNFLLRLPLSLEESGQVDWAAESRIKDRLQLPSDNESKPGLDAAVSFSDASGFPINSGSGTANGTVAETTPRAPEKGTIALENLLAGEFAPIANAFPKTSLRQDSAAQGLLRRGKDNVLADALPVQGANPEFHPVTPGQFGTAARGPMGYQWDQKFNGPNWVLEDISFADGQNGFAAAELGKVLRTQDGGKTWDTVLNLGFPYYWYGVQALDAQRAVISGFNNSTGDGVLRWTYDAGATWSDDVILTGNPGFNRWLDKITFVDDANGVVMASWTGGNHSTPTGGQSASDWAFSQADSSQAWFKGNFTFWPDGNVWVSGIHFCHSADYGQNWDCRGSIDPIFDGGGVSFPDADHGWVSGGSIAPEVRGWVHSTVDGGQTWSGRILDVPFPIRSTLFLNDNIGFAAGGNFYSGVGGIYSTNDGGKSWNLDLDAGAEIKSLKAIRTSPDTVDVWAAGFAPGFQGKIFSTQVYLPQ